MVYLKTGPLTDAKMLAVKVFILSVDWQSPKKFEYQHYHNLL